MTEISIAYTNLSSLVAKLTEFQLFISQHSPTCFVITETWLSQSVPDSIINIKGYTLHRFDRIDRRGGGVCIFAKTSFFKKFKVSVLNKYIPNIESLWLQCSNSDFSFTLVGIYRPGDTSRIIDDQIINYLNSASEQFNNLIVMGDFNLPSINWSALEPSNTNDSASAFGNMILNSNLTQLISEPTRYRLNQTPSLLDLVLTNDTNLISNIEMLPPIGCSDHIVILCTVQVLTYRQPRNTVEFFNRIDYTQLSNNLSNHQWQYSFDESNVELSWNHFHKTIHDYIQVCTETHSKLINPGKPYITPDFISRAKFKRTLWQKFKASNCPADFTNHREFSNKLTKDLRFAKLNYENNLLARGPKAVYKYTRSKLSSRVSTPLIRKLDGSLCETCADSAEVLANEFESAYTIEPGGMLPHILSSRILPSLETIQFSESSVLTQLNNLSLDSSPGPDLITVSVLKQCASALALPLSNIMQLSFSTSSLPRMWLNAVVTPIFKKGDKLVASNYRPISLTCICAKLMERIIATQLLQFLSDNSILPDSQHGFLPGRSSVTNLLYSLNLWTTNLDKGLPVDILYFDFSKAFDRVPKKRLLYKLEHLGIRGKLLSWISAYLTNRTFSVRVEKSFSTNHNVISGVPQGSVLGPVLYIIYTSDIPLHIASHHACFADDTKIFGCPFTNRNTLQLDILSLEKWCVDWLLPLNFLKCSVLHLGRNNPKLPYSFSNGDQLVPVESHTDLGIIINSKLDWSEHIGSIVRKANSSIYMFKKAFQSPSRGLFLCLYKNYIRPLLEYAAVIWSPYLIKDINLLENVQRKLTRWIPNISDLPYDIRLEILQLTSLNIRRERGDLIQYFKILTSHNPAVDLSYLFVLNTDERLRGHRLKLVKENFKTTVRQHFFSNRLVNKWNLLPTVVINAHSINEFKNALDIFNSTSLL